MAAAFRSRYTQVVRTGAAVAAWFVLCSMLPAQVNVSLPEDVTADPPQTVDVCLSMDPIDGMLAADIDVAYDPVFLNATAVQLTSVLQGFSLTTNLQAPGWIRISIFGTQTTTGGGCALNITFDALQAGCSLLYVSKASINEGEIASTIDHGMLTVLDTIDLDGDGVSESAGDCSDRFDWIYPGATEICNGADDDCDGSIDEDVFCPCGSYVAPRTWEFWERVCRGSSLEETISSGYVDVVNDYLTFTDVADPAGLCAIVLAEDDACTAAEAGFMAMVLNVASGRLCLEQPIDAGSTTSLDVNEAAVEVDLLLSNPSRTTQDCQDGAAIASEISTGAAIDEFLDAEIHVLARKQLRADGSLEALVLGWDEPDAAAAGRPTVYEVHRSPGSPATWLEIGESACPLWYPDFSARILPEPVDLYQVIGVNP